VLKFHHAKFHGCKQRGYFSLFCKLFLKLRLELCIVPSIYFCDSCFQFFSLKVRGGAYSTALGFLPNLRGKQRETEERREDVAKNVDEIKEIWSGGLCVDGFIECTPQFYYLRANNLLKTTYSTLMGLA